MTRPTPSEKVPGFEIMEFKLMSVDIEFMLSRHSDVKALKSDVLISLKSIEMISIEFKEIMLEIREMVWCELTRRACPAAWQRR